MKKILIATATLFSLAAPAHSQPVLTCPVYADDTYIPVEEVFSYDEPESAFIDGETIGSRVNVRTGPGLDYEVTTYGLVGEDVEIIGQAFSRECETWIQVRFPGSEPVGWVHKDFIGPKRGTSWW
ncbi:MAG: SH3 domain-containing protein [Cyanobacteria bacterium P01_E01_bin.43]